MLKKYWQSYAIAVISGLVAYAEGGFIHDKNKLATLVLIQILNHLLNLSQDLTEVIGVSMLLNWSDQNQTTLCDSHNNRERLDLIFSRNNSSTTTFLKLFLLSFEMMYRLVFQAISARKSIFT